MQLKKLSEDIYEAFGEASASVYDETRQHSELANKVTEAFHKAMREVGGWQKIAEVAFSTQRNRVLGIYATANPTLKGLDSGLRWS